MYKTPITPKLFVSGYGVFEMFRGGVRVGENREKIVRERGRGTTLILNPCMVTRVNYLIRGASLIKRDVDGMRTVNNCQR